MITVLFVNILAVLFAFAEDKKLIKHGLKISFFIIFLFLALRYDYGNDYAGYLDGFYEVNKHSWIDYTNTKEFFHYEAGWVFLNRLFEPLGFFAMIAFLAAVNCYVLYRFIRKYVPLKYYWLTIFLYTFTPSLMLIQLSAMRQAVAIIIFLIAFDYLYEKKIIPYTLLILLASTFHSSSILLIALYPLSLLNFSTNTTSATVITFFFILAFFLGDTIKPIIDNLVLSNFDRYEVYLDDKAEIGTGLGLVFNATLLFILLTYTKAYQNQQSLIFKLSAINQLLLPISALVMIIGRIGFYFQPFLLVAIALCLVKIKNPAFKVSFITLIITFSIYLFVTFFKSDVWIEKYIEYQTIISSPYYY